MTDLPNPPMEPLALGPKELSRLTQEALNGILSVQTEWPSVVKWAKAGGLIKAQRLGYGAPESFRLSKIDIDAGLYRSTVNKISATMATRLSSSQRYDLLLAAAEGVNLIKGLHKETPEPAVAMIARYFQEQSSTMSANRLYGPWPDRGESIDEAFLDPRLPISALPSAFFYLAVKSNNKAIWDQARLKEGFENAFISALSDAPMIAPTMIQRCLDRDSDEKSVAIQALRLLWDNKALPPIMAEEIAYKRVGASFFARRALELAGVPWPESGEEPAHPLRPLFTAISNRAPDNEVEHFFNLMTIEGWEASHAKQSSPNLIPMSLLWRVAMVLPPEMFERALDQLDAAGSEAWARWLEGPAPSIQLDSRSTRSVDWLTGLCWRNHSLESVERVLQRQAPFSFSETKASLRWLKERSVGAKSADGLANAKTLLTRTLVIQETLELRSHSEKASAKAAPAPTKAPSRRLSL